MRNSLFYPQFARKSMHRLARGLVGLYAVFLLMPPLMATSAMLAASEADNATAAMQTQSIQHTASAVSAKVERSARAQAAAPVTQIETVAVDFEVTYVADATMAQGEQVITQEGITGEAVVTTLHSDTEVQTLDYQIVTPATTQVVAYGTRAQDVGTGTLISPLRSYRFTSGYGNRASGMHKGVDLCADYGTNILAADNGVVTFSGWKDGYGNCVIIDHQNGMQTLYAHASSLAVSEGTTVQQGDTIAYVGSTGTSTANHVHFEVRLDGVAVNPVDYVTL